MGSTIGGARAAGGPYGLSLSATARLRDSPLTPTDDKKSAVGVAFPRGLFAGPAVIGPTGPTRWGVRRAATTVIAPKMATSSAVIAPKNASTEHRSLPARPEAAAARDTARGRAAPRTPVRRPDPDPDPSVLWVAAPRSPSTLGLLALGLLGTPPGEQPREHPAFLAAGLRSTPENARMQGFGY